MEPLSVNVIIPVGPGHNGIAAGLSVRRAWKRARGPFTDYLIVWIDDRYGRMGRSRARNQGIDHSQADFRFFLDADDEMTLNAFNLVDLDAAATFGAVCLDGRISKENVWPVTWETLFERGARGTLSMGVFCRGDLGLRFNEEMDAGEDYDFYMRLPDFVKVKEPLVNIGYRKPSAGGPRGYKRIRWIEICDNVIQSYSTTR